MNAPIAPAIAPGERVYVPVRAQFSIEHERKGSEEEIEIQIKWNNE